MKFLLVVIILFFVSSFNCAYARPRQRRESLVLTPERRLIRIEREGNFRIYARNNFPVALQDLRLIVTNPAFEIEVVPASIARLATRERRFFLVKLKLRDGFELGEHSLKVSVQARGIDLETTIETVEIIAEEDEFADSKEKMDQSAVVKVGEIVIQVERFVFSEGKYIYFLPISLIGLLLWRKLKQK